jgi:hypothetical protein
MSWTPLPTHKQRRQDSMSPLNLKFVLVFSFVFNLRDKVIVCLYFITLQAYS